MFLPKRNIIKELNYSVLYLTSGFIIIMVIMTYITKVKSANTFSKFETVKVSGHLDNFLACL